MEVEEIEALCQSQSRFSKIIPILRSGFLKNPPSTPVICKRRLLSSRLRRKTLLRSITHSTLESIRSMSHLRASCLSKITRHLMFTMSFRSLHLQDLIYQAISELSLKTVPYLKPQITPIPFPQSLNTSKNR